MMYFASLLLFICNGLIYTNAYPKCCPEENMISHKTCSDGSNITTLPCEERVLYGPAEDPPVYLEIDEDDNLLITDEEEAGYIRVEADKYCMTRRAENESLVALVCTESDEEFENSPSFVFFYIKAFCSLISVLFLLSICIIYIFIPDLQDIEGKCIINLAVSCTVALLVQVFVPLTMTSETVPCDVIAFIYCTAELCLYNWLCVLSFHLWKITIRPIFEIQIPWFLVYFCYGYGVPLLVLVTALIMHHSQDTELQVGEIQCFFDGNVVVWSYTYGPIMLMISISTVLQLWAAKKVWWDIDTRNQSHTLSRLRRKTLMYLHLLLVVGLVIIIDMISYIFLQANDYLDVVWDILDCRYLLTGGAIFFILVVLRVKVLKALAKHGLFCLKFPKTWEKLIDEESEERHSEEAHLTRDVSEL